MRVDKWAIQNIVVKRLMMSHRFKLERVTILFIKLGHCPQKLSPEDIELDASCLQNCQHHIFVFSWCSAQSISDAVFASFVVHKCGTTLLWEQVPVHYALCGKLRELMSEIFVACVNLDLCTKQHWTKSVEHLHHTWEFLLNGGAILLCSRELPGVVCNFPSILLDNHTQLVIAGSQDCDPGGLVQHPWPQTPSAHWMLATTWALIETPWLGEGKWEVQ